MDHFDVVLGMQFLLELNVIPIPLAKCLMITGFTLTIMHRKIKQPNEMKMISIIQLKKSLNHESVGIVEETIL